MPGHVRRGLSDRQAIAPRSRSVVSDISLQSDLLPAHQPPELDCVIAPHSLPTSPDRVRYHSLPFDSLSPEAARQKRPSMRAPVPLVGSVPPAASGSEHSHSVPPRPPRCPQPVITQPQPDTRADSVIPGAALGVTPGQPAPPTSAPFQPRSPIFADFCENCCRVDLPINLLVEPLDHLHYTSALRRAGHRRFTLFSRKGCEPRSTMVKGRSSSHGEEGVQSPLFRITRELTIFLRCACYRSDLTFEGWADPTVVALRKVPAANSPGQSRGPPPYSLFAVDDGV